MRVALTSLLRCRRERRGEPRARQRVAARELDAERCAVLEETPVDNVLLAEAIEEVGLEEAGVAAAAAE